VLRHVKTASKAPIPDNLSAELALMKPFLETTAAFDQQEKLNVVDALRGYAILLVIVVHAEFYVTELVWPARRLQMYGYYGVQLFFIASALTLLMSWHRSRDAFGVRSAKFLVRRFFRIAPLYFLAIPFYWVINGFTAQDFSFSVLAATLFFYNAWSPYLIPNVPGWMPVPGGWSISVEFCFYFVFPILATLVTSLFWSIVFIAVAVVIMVAALILGPNLYPEISSTARSNFLYFWPPNQLIVFSLGFLLYQGVKSPDLTRLIANSRINANKATALLVVLLLVLAYGAGEEIQKRTKGLVPMHVLVSVGFMLWALILVNKPVGVAINPWIIKLGQVSFSAYVLHFAVYRLTNFALGLIWPFGIVGVASIFYAFVLITITTFVTWFVASLAYTWIEQPFIAMGKKLTANRRLRA
jgi:peptidoglycan/LPS O-acetylase OafA/YrhL